ncbi:hypothetical protein N7451_002929 [Penicillium sp. IBT 35674x]|nr:hypothetical protein N7451_002929 [Penicillium sp. IBT 35674x]
MTTPTFYCGAECQKSHWPEHKVACKSDLGKEGWQPSWARENRAPMFVGNSGGELLGGKKYLWGNVPAYDVLKLGSNEGERYAKHLNVLFAAAGDLRNIVKTIVNLPTSYNHGLTITINDFDIDLVARNVIMLLVALVVDDMDEAVDCIIHVWYSALMRASDMVVLETRIRPLIRDVCDKLKNKPPEKYFSRKWEVEDRSLRVILTPPQWNHLLGFLEKPVGLNAERVRQIRIATTLAHSRRDYHDRYMTFLSLSQRLCFNKFREDGLLLPFGYPRHEFTEPNPTIFQDTDTWPMKDSADPLCGWSLEEVLHTSSGPATADVYGKLFFFLRGQLHSFLSRMQNLRLRFEILNFSPKDLPDRLEKGWYSRIEVSGIADAGALGIHRTLNLMAPLLQSPLQNPHATLITLFLNTVNDNLTAQDKLQIVSMESREMKSLFEFLPPNGSPIDGFETGVVKFSFAREIVGRYDHVFGRFMKKTGFKAAGEVVGLKMKEKHTVIEKWPFRLKLRPGQPGAQEEFDRRMREGISGKERYVEWKKIHQNTV